MGVEYPKDFKSDYPVVLRKAAKLAVALYYDFLENELLAKHEFDKWCAAT